MNQSQIAKTWFCIEFLIARMRDLSKSKSMLEEKKNQQLEGV